jgi:diguanylate cyclase
MKDSTDVAEHGTPTQDGPGKLIRGTRATRSAKTVALRRSEVFSSLGQAELEAIADSSRLYAFAAGERVFARGEPGDALYVVLDGSVRMLGETAGESNVVAELVVGDTLGELDLLSSTPRSATAEAAADSVVLRFPARTLDLEAVFDGHPLASAQLLFAALRVVAGRIRRANSLVKDNSPWIQEVRRQVYGDKLTGLYNKTYLEESARQEIGRTPRGALLLFKPDNFKLINDTCGHEAGDAVLKLVAVEVSRHLAEGESAVRYMGNELGVFMPGADAAVAGARADELRAALKGLDLSPAIGARDVRLTASFGVALYPDHASTAEALIAAAHALPLVGRDRGGDRVLFSGDAA